MMSLSSRSYLALGMITIVGVTSFLFWKNSDKLEASRNLVSIESVQVASTSLSPTITSNPNSKTFHILLVPGHDTNSGGGRYLNTYERDLAVDLAQDIVTDLKDSDIDVMIARDKSIWNSVLADYFLNEENSILQFKNEHQSAEKKLLDSGEKKVVPDAAAHTTVDKKTAVELYGINKWVNEHNIDMVLHIHFNDSGRPNYSVPGTYSGFDVFMPESQLPNSAISKDLASDIFQELKKVSRPEINSVIQDQSLIAIGASSTLSKPSVLVEYAYIYEKPLREEATRVDFLKKLSGATAIGIKKYLNASSFLDK